MLMSSPELVLVAASSRPGLASREASSKGRDPPDAATSRSYPSTTRRPGNYFLFSSQISSADDPPDREGGNGGKEERFGVDRVNSSAYERANTGWFARTKNSAQ